MKCPFCNSEMIWMNDLDLEQNDSENLRATISSYMCSNNKCNCEAEFTKRENENEKIDS